MGTTRQRSRAGINPSSLASKKKVKKEGSYNARTMGGPAKEARRGGQGRRRRREGL